MAAPTATQREHPSPRTALASPVSSARWSAASGGWVARAYEATSICIMRVSASRAVIALATASRDTHGKGRPGVRALTKEVTVEQVAQLWFGEVGEGGSASSEPTATGSVTCESGSSRHPADAPSRFCKARLKPTNFVKAK